MEFVYEVVNNGKLKQVLEENPYEENSFSRIGYQIKENIIEDGKTYLYINTDEKIMKEKFEKIKELVREVNEDTKRKVCEKIKEENENAAKGFGDIFG